LRFQRLGSNGGRRGWRWRLRGLRLQCLVGNHGRWGWWWWLRGLQLQSLICLCCWRRSWMIASAIVGVGSWIHLWPDPLPPRVIAEPILLPYRICGLADLWNQWLRNRLVVPIEHCGATSGRRSSSQRLRVKGITFSHRSFSESQRNVPYLLDKASPARRSKTIGVHSKADGNCLNN